MGVMEQIDNQVMRDGKSGIWSDFSVQGKHAIAASAVANCRLKASSATRKRTQKPLVRSLKRVTPRH